MYLINFFATRENFCPLHFSLDSEFPSGVDGFADTNWHPTQEKRYFVLVPWEKVFSFNTSLLSFIADDGIWSLFQYGLQTVLHAVFNLLGSFFFSLHQILTRGLWWVAKLDNLESIVEWSVKQNEELLTEGWSINIGIPVTSVLTACLV